MPSSTDARCPVHTVMSRHRGAGTLSKRAPGRPGTNATAMRFVSRNTVGRRPPGPYRPAMPLDELPTDASTPRGRPRARAAAFRVVLVFFALVWLTFGFGVIDFSSGFTSVDDRDPLGIGVLSVAYGAVAGIVLPVAFLSLLRAPQRRPAAVQQLAAVAVAFALAGTIGLDPLSFISVGMVVVMLAAVLALHPARPRLRPDRHSTDRRVLAVAAAGAVPWLVYAAATAANSRGRVPPDDLAARPQAGGWAGATVLALAVVLLALLAATSGPGRRVPLWSAALASTAFGVVSLLNPSAPGSPGAAWGAAAVAWSLALLLTGEMSEEATANGRPSPRDR